MNERTETPRPCPATLHQGAMPPPSPLQPTGEALDLTALRTLYATAFRSLEGPKCFACARPVPLDTPDAGPDAGPLCRGCEHFALNANISAAGVRYILACTGDPTFPHNQVVAEQSPGLRAGQGEADEYASLALAHPSDLKTDDQFTQQEQVA